MRYVNASSRRLRLAGRNLIIMARSIRRANAAEALTSDDNKDFLKNHCGRKILRQVFGEFSSLTREIGHVRITYTFTCHMLIIIDLFGRLVLLCMCVI